MANSLYEQKTGGGMKNSAKKGGEGTFNEKPGFPSTDLPGKSQPKDRSAGIKKCKVDPRRIGL